MGIWDTVTDIFSGGGRSDIGAGYRDANNYMDPYRRYGMEDYSRYRNDVANMGNNLDRYGNAESRFYNELNMSSPEYYNSIMNGYSESPEAAYNKEQAMKALTYGASASGMVGSGAFMKALQDNANRISQNDRQQYYNNVMGAGNHQFDVLRNLQDQRNEYRNRMSGLADRGYNSAYHMGQNAINEGHDYAGLDRQTIEDIMGLLGYGKGSGENSDKFAMLQKIFGGG